MSWLWKKWAESLFIAIGQALTKAGGAVMSLGIMVWTAIAKAAEELLRSDPFSGNSQSSAFSISVGTVFSLALSIGISLTFLYTFISIFRGSIDVTKEITIEKLTKHFLRLVIAIFLVESTMFLAKDIVKISMVLVGSVEAETVTGTVTETAVNRENSADTLADTTALAADPTELSEADSYGYFSDIYRNLTSGTTSAVMTAEKEDSKEAVTKTEEIGASDWMTTGLICLVGGVIGGIAVIIASFEMLTAVFSRIFFLILCLPFGPVALSSLAGDDKDHRRAISWLRSFIVYSAEAFFMALVIRVSTSLFADILPKPADTSPLGTAITGIMNICIPLLAGAGCVKGAEEITGKFLGT